MRTTVSPLHHTIHLRPTPQDVWHQQTKHEQVTMATPFSLVRGIPPPRGYGAAFDDDSEDEDPAHCVQIAISAEIHDIQPHPSGMFPFVSQASLGGQCVCRSVGMVALQGSHVCPPLLLFLLFLLLVHPLTDKQRRQKRVFASTVTN